MYILRKSWYIGKVAHLAFFQNSLFIQHLRVTGIAT